MLILKIIEVAIATGLAGGIFYGGAILGQEGDSE